MNTTTLKCVSLPVSALDMFCTGSITEVQRLGAILSWTIIRKCFNMKKYSVYVKII